MHWTRRVGLLCLCLTVAATAREARAQQRIMDSSGTVILDDFSGAMSLSNDGGTYVLFHKMVGDGVGYDDGFTRVGLRAKMVDWETSHLFAEMHSLITDNGRFGFNVGSGYRMLFNDGVLGVHAWYDNFEANSRNRYEQVSFGMEYLHPGFDFRANGYVPVGDRDNFLRIVDPGTNLIYFGNSIGTVGTGLFERALDGWDAEAGVPMPVIDWLRGYAGMYFLNDGDDKTSGFKARFEARVAEGVILNAITTNDDKFGTNVNLSVEVRLDGRGAPTRFGQDYSALSRRYDQVWRDWSVHLANATESINVPLVNPATGRDYSVYWVDNTNTGGGAGSFEDPNAVLPDGVDNADLILVRAGNGPTDGNIRLVGNQRLLGEGSAHFIDTDRLGVIQLFDFASAGARPTLSALDPADPVVTLASGAEVSSFNILGDATGILGNGVNGFDISNVNVDADAPLSLINVRGIGNISDSTFTSQTGTPAINISNVLNTAFTLNAQDVVTSGGASGLRLAVTNGSATLNMDGFTGTNHSLAGIDIRGQMAVINADIEDATVNGLAGSGVMMSLDSTTGIATFTNLQASNNAADGLSAEGSDGANYAINVIDSTVAGNVDDNFDVSAVNPLGAPQPTVVTLFVDPTNASNAGDNNFELEVIGTSTLAATIEDTNMTGAGRDSLNARADDGGILNLLVENSPGNGSINGDGLDLTVSDGSAANVTVTNGSFSGSDVNGAGRGIAANVFNGSALSLTLTDTPAAGNGRSGFVFNVNGGLLGASTMTADVTNGSFSNNPTSNVAGTVTGNSTATLNFNNVTADNQSTSGGLNLRALTGGDIVGVWTSGSISNTQGHGVEAFADGVGSSIGVTFNGVNIDGNAGDGVNAILQNGGAGSNLSLAFNSTTVNNVVTPTTIRNNAGDGVDMSTSGAGATGALQFGGATVTGNTGDGVQFDVLNGASMTGTETPGSVNVFTGNGGNAIQGTVNGTNSSATVAVAGATINSTNDDALIFNVNAGGNLTFSLSDSSISSQNGDGLLANVNGGTATFNLTNVTANDNAGSGYVFNGLNNALFDVNFLGTMQATDNDENGILFSMLGGSDIAFDIVGGDLSNNGSTGNFSGLKGTVDGAGSTAVMTFTDTLADNNTLHGFEFEVDNGGLLTSVFTSTTDGALSASGNTGGSGIQITGTNASQANLVIEGNGNFTGNNAAGVVFDINGAAQAIAKASGQFTGNGADGITINMANVTTGAIDITGPATSLSDNLGEGLDISLTNTNLTGASVARPNTSNPVQQITAAALRVDGTNISRNGGDGIRIVANNSDLTSGVISNNIIEENQDGIDIDLSGGSDWNLTIGGNRTGISSNIGSNQINLNRGTGILIDADSGTSQISVLNNDIVSNATANVTTNFNGTAVVDLDLNGNEISGNGRTSGFQIQRNFTGRIHNGFPTPPDTQGAVGPAHIVEALNTGYAVYDKNTGAVLQNMSLTAFFQQAGVFVNGSAGDPRIIYDPQSNRWFVIAFDAQPGFNGLGVNNIHIAVSRTSDPLQGFRATTISGDLYQVNFVDYPTLGIDGDALYIGTNNFGAGLNQNFASTSIYIIPKADLLLTNPSTLNIARFEGLPVVPGFGGIGGLPSIQQTPQPVVDLYRPADSVGTFIGSSVFGGSTFTRLDILGAGAVGPSMGVPQTIFTPQYTPPPGGQQPGVPAFAQLDAIDGRITSNVMRIGDSIWAVHGVQSTAGRSAARWYEIDANTNQVLQVGTIEDPNIDFLVPSIAANAQGGVVIGFTMTGQALNPSAAFVAGKTVNGVTTFGTPTISRLGTGVQDPIFFASRWGDYTATVLDPTDSNRFWTFQEFVDSGTFPSLGGFPSVGIQMTEIFFDERSTIVGTTAGNGVNINLNGDARLAAGSTFNDNTITGHAGGDGLNLNVSGTANVAGFTMTGTSISGSGDNGIDIRVTGNNPGERSVFNIGQIGADKNNISGNTNQNIRFETTAGSISQLQTAANPDVNVLVGQNNPAPNAYVDTGSTDVLAVTFNVLNSDINNSTASHGVEMVVGSSTLVNSQIAGNTFSGNFADDLRIRPVVSNDGTEASPPSSINSAVPNSDVLVFDPVAHLDLALGAVDTNGDNIPNGTPLATVRNIGESLFISFLGNNFSNADPFKNDRAVRLAGQVQIAGTLDTNNTFSGIPSVNAIFAPQAGTFNIVPATLFPDITVP